MQHDYWRRQTADKPLFPDIEWSRPERRDSAGRLGIIGGNKLGFSGVASSFATALDCGVGQVRVLLPDVLKKTIPTTIIDTVYAASTPSGSLATDALQEMNALGDWANGILLAGDAGRNSETAIVYEKFISSYCGPLTVTRDAIDLVKHAPELLVERPDTLVVASFAQTQKLFQAVYYPRMLTFSMQLLQLVEAMHKFTITYQLSVVTLHQNYLVIARDGQIVTLKFDQPARIWRGDVASCMAAYWLWNQNKLLEACTTSVRAL